MNFGGNNYGTQFISIEEREKGIHSWYALDSCRCDIRANYSQERDKYTRLNINSSHVQVVHATIIHEINGVTGL